MALLIRDKTKCALCSQIIRKDEEIIGFSYFIQNEADPLSLFNDGVFHALCFRQHPLASSAEARFVEHNERVSPQNRRCFICDRPIDNPDDYLATGHLSENTTDAIYRFNYAQFHRTCLSTWSELDHLCGQIKYLQLSGKWKGPALYRLLDELKTIG